EDALRLIRERSELRARFPETRLLKLDKLEESRNHEQASYSYDEAINMIKADKDLVVEVNKNRPVWHKFTSEAQRWRIIRDPNYSGHV
ncbi:MAG: hypothetical protein ACSW8A_10220, partial [Lachnospiraceae bacterium]